MTALPTARAARIYRIESHGAHVTCITHDVHLQSAQLTDARVGDLLESATSIDLRWYIRSAHGWTRLGRRLGLRTAPLGQPGAFWVVINRDESDLFTDALAHYADAFCEQAGRRPVAGYSNPIRLLLEVRPSDAGLRREFAAREPDWLLVSQWHSLRLAWHSGCWCIERVDYGNELTVVGICRRRSRTSGAPVFRKLSLLVEGYRASLAPTRRAFLLFGPAHALPGTGVAVLECVADALAPMFWWQVHALRRVNMSGDWCYAVQIVGPRDSTSLDRISAALGEATIGASALGEATLVDLRAYLMGIVVEDDPMRSSIFKFIAECQADWSAAVSIPRNAYQWSALHQFLLDRALALAPLHLPAYVLLWVLEWLPEMRHHVHVQAIRLIEGVKASVRRLRHTD